MPAKEDVAEIAQPLINEVYEFLKEFADAGFSPAFLEEQGFQYAVALQKTYSRDPQYNLIAHHMRIAKTVVIAALAHLHAERRKALKQQQEEEAYAHLAAANPGVITGP